MEPGQPLDQYWPSLDQDGFARAYFAKVQGQGGLEGYGLLTGLQRIAYRHFYGALPANFVGDMPSSAQANRAGVQGENIEVRVNQWHIHVKAKHQIIVAPKLAWGCEAVNTNSQSMVDSSRGAAILEYEWKSTPIERMAIAAQLGGGIAGEEFIVTLWNKQAGKAKSFDKATGTVTYAGGIEAHSVSSWDVLRQHNARVFEASPWLSARIPRNRWDLIAQHPDMREEILAIPASNTTNGNNQTSLTANVDPDIVIAHYFFHRKTPALPLGLQAVLLSADCVLEFEALETCYEHLPIHRFNDGELKGTPYAYSSSWEAMGIQDIYTDIQGSLATNITVFAKQMISAEQDQDLPVDQLGNGPAVLYRPKGSTPPTPLALYAAQPEMFQHLERLRGDMRSTFGLNDMAMGEPPQGPPNAQAWALLATANITNNSDAQRNFVDSVRSVGRSILNILKVKLDDKRKARIVGDFGAATAEQTEYDKADLQGFDDVTITIDNPLMQTAAGRLPIAQMYIDLGMAQVPEQVETLVTTGKLTPLTQVLRNEVNFIAAENEAFLRGEVPPVMISDSHQLHIREHKDAMFLPNGRKDPKVIEAYNAHFKQHCDMALGADPRLLALLGQAAPPAPGMPPEAPPGGASPKAPKQAAAALQPPGSPAQGEAAKIPVPSAPGGTQPNPAAGGIQ